MSAFSADVTLAVTTTAIFGLSSLEGDAIIFVKNNGAQPVSINYYSYPDGVTPVADASVAADLQSIPAGGAAISKLPTNRFPQFSMDGTASLGTQSVHVEISQPPITRGRSKKRVM